MCVVVFSFNFFPGNLLQEKTLRDVHGCKKKRPKRKAPDVCQNQKRGRSAVVFEGL